MAESGLPDSPAINTKHLHSPAPTNYTVIPEERLVSVKFEKRLSFREIRSYAASLRSDPLFDPRFSEIVDLSEVEDLRLSSEEALALADIVDPFSIGAKRAFVARTEMQIGAARMHHLLRNDETNTLIFPTLADAKKWIERETGYVDFGLA